MVMDLFKRKKSLGELEEEGERLEAEVSVEQKKVLLAELKKRGLQAKHFGDTSQPSTWQKIKTFLKNN